MATRVAPKIVPKGTPLSVADPTQLSVLSYNCLAPIYVRPLDARTGTVQAFAAFPWAEPAEEVLDWEVRWPRILREIKAAQADVICLQEVQFEPVGDDAVSKAFRLPMWLDSLLGYGYSAHFAGQSGLRQIAERNERVLGTAAPVGNAVLYRNDRLEGCSLVDREGVSATSSGNGGKKAKKDAVKDTTTRVGVCVQGRAGSALEHKLGPTAVFSVHLDATSEEQRVKQLGKCLAHARAMGSRQVVVAGDFNSELWKGSCVEAFLDHRGQAAAAAAAAAAVASSGAPPSLGGEPSYTLREEEEEEEATPPREEDLVRECASALRLTSDESNGMSDDAPSSSSSSSSAASASTTAPRPTTEQMAAWMALREGAFDASRKYRVELCRAPTGATRAAYDHGQHQGPCRSWRLDHVLYSTTAVGGGAGSAPPEDGEKQQAHTPDSFSSAVTTASDEGLVCTQVWAGLEEDPASASAGLPNRTCPSDHLPVACSFACSLVPPLTAAATEALVLQWRELQSRFAEEAAALAERQQAEETALRLSEPPPAAAPTSANEGLDAGAVASAAGAVDDDSSDKGGVGSTQKKKKKKAAAKARPSEATVSLLGQHRRQRQALSARHDAERVAAAEAFVVSDTERDAAERLGIFDLSPPTP